MRNGLCLFGSGCLHVCMPLLLLTGPALYASSDGDGLLGARIDLACKVAEQAIASAKPEAGRTEPERSFLLHSAYRLLADLGTEVDGLEGADLGLARKIWPLFRLEIVASQQLTSREERAVADGLATPIDLYTKFRDLADNWKVALNEVWSLAEATAYLDVSAKLPDDEHMEHVRQIGKLFREQLREPQHEKLRTRFFRIADAVISKILKKSDKSQRNILEVLQWVEDGDRKYLRQTKSGLHSYFKGMRSKFPGNGVDIAEIYGWVKVLNDLRFPLSTDDDWNANGGLRFSRLSFNVVSLPEWVKDYFGELKDHGVPQTATLVSSNIQPRVRAPGAKDTWPSLDELGISNYWLPIGDEFVVSFADESSSRRIDVSVKCKRNKRVMLRVPDTVPAGYRVMTDLQCENQYLVSKQPISRARLAWRLSKAPRGQSATKLLEGWGLQAALDEKKYDEFWNICRGSDFERVSIEPTVAKLLLRVAAETRNIDKGAFDLLPGDVIGFPSIKKLGSDSGETKLEVLDATMKPEFKADPKASYLYVEVIPYE